MQSLQSAIGRRLRWQPRSAFARTYDLVDPQNEGAEPYATLAWRRGLFLGGPAEARSGDGAWRFERRGLFRGEVVVTAGNRPDQVGTLRWHWRRAVLRLESGREYTWRRESCWSRVGRFEDPNCTPVVRLRRTLWPPSGAARVEIESSGGDASERALLACLGWYLSVLESHRRAAAAGA